METVTEKKGKEVIVSMTSFPAAIPYAIGAIKSLLRQSVTPDKIVLYLTFSQFDDSGLPEDLLQLAEKNEVFEIRDYPRDIRSYRKLVPALKDFPEAVIITVDDDVAYHRNMVRDLLRLHEKEPDAILAHRAKEIKPDRPYREWKKYRWYHFLTGKIKKSFLNIQTGVGGVLYPPGALKAEMIEEELFTEIAPTTDDIWFWAAGAATGTPVIPVPFGHNKPKGLHKPKSLSLKTTNFKTDTDRNSAALKAIFQQFPDLKKICCK